MTILFLITQFFLTISFPDETYEYMTNQETKAIFQILYNGLIIPTLLFWIYNIVFLFRYDRYSKSIFFLFIFNILYSPIYFYSVNFKKRPLVNKIKTEPIIGNTIQLENYENEDDFERDSKNNFS
jgi:hypothetical protein